MRAYYSLSSRPVRLEDDDVDEDALSAAFLLLPSLPMLHSLLLLCLSATFRLVFPRRAPSRLTSPMNDCSCCWWWWCCWWSFTATKNTASSQNSLSTDDRRQRPLRAPSEDWLGHLIMWLQIALLLVCTAAVAFHFCPFSAGGNLACCTPLQPHYVRLFCFVYEPLFVFPCSSSPTNLLCELCLSHKQSWLSIIIYLNGEQCWASRCLAAPVWTCGRRRRR